MHKVIEKRVQKIPWEYCHVVFTIVMSTDKLAVCQYCPVISDHDIDTKTQIYVFDFYQHASRLFTIWFGWCLLWADKALLFGEVTLGNSSLSKLCLYWPIKGRWSYDIMGINATALIIEKLVESTFLHTKYKVEKTLSWLGELVL